MADFLTAVSTKKVKDHEPLIREVTTQSKQEDPVTITSPKSALEALKNQPNRETFGKILKYLSTEGFNIILPEPLNASIAHQLVNDTVPNYWRTIKTSADTKRLGKILRNPIGLGHFVTRLRSLIADSRQKKAPGEARNTSEHISDTLDVLDLVLSGDETTHIILKDVLAFAKNSIQKKLIWREYLAQAVSGRLLSTAAEAEDVLKKSEETSSVNSWIADGNEYATWLGRNIANLIERGDQNQEYIAAVVELFSKALSLGYTGMSIPQQFHHILNYQIGLSVRFLQRWLTGAILRISQASYLS